MRNGQVEPLKGVVKTFYNQSNPLQKQRHPCTSHDYRELFSTYSNAILKASLCPPDEYIISKEIRTILNYFYGIKDFDKDKVVTSTPSLNKGLLVMGDFGVGKSMLFDILHKMGLNLYKKYKQNHLRFSQIVAIDFVQEYMESAKTQREANKEFNIERYYTFPLHIDELGKESKAFNRVELMGQVLFNRHRRQSKTHITTNMNLEEINDRYGDHIGDRLPEMFNIIHWTGDSFRE